MQSTRRVIAFVACILLAQGCASTRPAEYSAYRFVVDPQHRPAHAMTPDEPDKPSVSHRILWYVPNRVLDLFDFFRIRLRAGPGLAVHIRATELADVYAGQYQAAYVGLPGPRMAPELRSLVGFERERGIRLMGVDATDDLPHEPGYSPTEFNAGIQLLVLGVELGVDPMKLADFFAGFLLFDLRQDDR